MNSTVSNVSAVQGGMPTWSDRDQFFKTRRWFRVLISVIVILWVILITWVLVSPFSRCRGIAPGYGS